MKAYMKGLILLVIGMLLNNIGLVQHQHEIFWFLIQSIGTGIMGTSIVMTAFWATTEANKKNSFRKKHEYLFLQDLEQRIAYRQKILGKWNFPK